MNLNNIEFEFMISGECSMRKQYHIDSGTEKLILELSDINSIVAYQTWSSDTLLLNNKKRVAFSMLPGNFDDVVKNYNAKYPDGKYMPTCVLKTGDEVMYMNVIDIYLKSGDIMNGSNTIDLDCLCSGDSHSFSRGSLIMVADNNFTHLGKSMDGERIPMSSFINETEFQNAERSMYVNINLSALPYSDIDYNLEDRLYHPFMKIHRSHHFTKPAEKNTNRYKYHTYLTLHETLAKPPVEMPPERTYNYIINDHAVIKHNKKGRFLVIDNPKMITAYQDWTKETRSFGQGKRLLHTIPASEFVTEVAKINSHLKMGRQPMQPYKFTPTAYLEIKYPDKTVKTLVVLRDVEYNMSTSRADGQYSSNVTPQLIIRLNEYQMVDEEGNYISDVMTSNEDKVDIFMNIDDTPTKDYTDDNKSVSSINSKDLRATYLNLGLVSLAKLHTTNIVDMHMFLGFNPKNIILLSNDSTNDPANDPASSDESVNSTFQISVPSLDTLLSNNRSSSDALGDKLLKGSTLASNKFASLNKKIVKRSVLSSKKRDPTTETNNIGIFKPPYGSNDMRIYVKVSKYNDDPNKPKYHFLKTNDEPMTDQNMVPNFGLMQGYNYIFDQSDESNNPYGLLSFTNDWRSLVNDQLVLNRYTRGVQYVGNPGRDNLAYVEITVTKNTNSPLYYYANKGTGAREMGIQEPNSTNPNISPALVSIVAEQNPTNSGLNWAQIGGGIGGGAAAVIAYLYYRNKLSKGASATFEQLDPSDVYQDMVRGDIGVQYETDIDAVINAAQAGVSILPVGAQVMVDGQFLVPFENEAAGVATAAVAIPTPAAEPVYAELEMMEEASGLARFFACCGAGSRVRPDPEAAEDPYATLDVESLAPKPPVRPSQVNQAVTDVTDAVPGSSVGIFPGVEGVPGDLADDYTLLRPGFPARPIAGGGDAAGEYIQLDNAADIATVAPMPAVRAPFDPSIGDGLKGTPAISTSEDMETWVKWMVDNKKTFVDKLTEIECRELYPEIDWPPFVPRRGAKNINIQLRGACSLEDSAPANWNSAGEPSTQTVPENLRNEYYETCETAIEDVGYSIEYIGDASVSELAADTEKTIAESAANAEAAGVTESELDDLVNSVKQDAERWIPEGSGVSESDITSAMDSAESILKTELSASADGSIPTEAVQSALKNQLTIAGVDSEYAEQIATGITSDISYASAVGNLNTIAEKGANAITEAGQAAADEAGNLGDTVSGFAESFTPQIDNSIAAQDLSNAVTDASARVTTQQVNDIIASKGITNPTTADIKNASNEAFQTNLEKGLQDNFETSSANLSDLASTLADTSYAANNIAAVTSAYEENVKSIIDKFSGELAASEFTSDSAQKILQGLQDPPASLSPEEATAQMNGKITDAVKSAIEKTPPPVDAQSPEGLSEYSTKIEQSIDEELTTSFGTWENAAGDEISVSALEGVGDDAASEAAGVVAKGAGEDAGSIIADLFG